MNLLDVLWNIILWLAASTTLWELIGIAISGGIAAYFGAWGAQRIITSDNSFQTLRREINLIASAQLISVSIANVAMAMKRQHALPLKKKYDEAVKAVHTANKNSAPVIHIQLDLQKLPIPFLAVHQLERILFEDVLLSGRALGAFNGLLGAIDLLKTSIDERNKIIDVYQSSGWESSKITKKYLGLSTNNGKDEVYSNLVDSIYLYSNDVIFFSIVLAEDLHVLAERKKSSSKRKNEIPNLPKISWSVDDDLVPKRSEYDSWLKGFPDEPVPLALS